MWAAREERFPEHTPMNKEYYLLRSIFEEYYPKPSALETVPKGVSIACSTPEAVSWDPTWANVHDISGRAVSFHDAADGYKATGQVANVSAPMAVAARALRTRMSVAGGLVLGTAGTLPVRKPIASRARRVLSGVRGSAGLGLLLR
jgi:asparagine synthase (glutamine-hydrolysing)